MAEQEDAIKVRIELDRDQGLGRIIMPGGKPFCFVELVGGDDESLSFEATIGGGLEQDITKTSDLLEIFAQGLRGHEVPGEGTVEESQEESVPGVPWSPPQRACNADNPNGPVACVRAPGHPGAHRSMSDGRWER